jgi:hypothetical protein
MVTARFARARINGKLRGGENILPQPFARGIWILAFERKGQKSLAASGAHVIIMLHLDFQEMSFERRDERTGQNRAAVFRALAVAHDDLTIAEINVLDAQPHAFHHARDPRRRAATPSSDARLRAGAKTRPTSSRVKTTGRRARAFSAFDALDQRKFDFQHVTIEKQKRGERDILRRSRDAAARRQGGERNCRISFAPISRGWRLS